eukprot:6405429-Lingulodinium_polyedra.AAC.1
MGTGSSRSACCGPSPANSRGPWASSPGSAGPWRSSTPSSLPCSGTRSSASSSSGPPRELGIG